MPICAAFGPLFLLIVVVAFAGHGVSVEEQSRVPGTSGGTGRAACRAPGVSGSASHSHSPLQIAENDAEDAYRVRVFTDPATGMEFVLVKGGCYQMGDTFGDGYHNEKPVHEVCVDDFYIGKFEVTQGQWKKVRGANPSYFGECGDDCPVENVSWDAAQEFIRTLNTRTGRSYRLPTEAEWEYAARSGGKREKWAGTSRESELGEYAWYSGNSGIRPHPVGRKKPNGIGIYDMSGNVWEWVQDVYSGAAYSLHSRRNPVYTGRGAGHVFRGGSWYYDPKGIRATFRDHRTPAIIIRHHTIGFRLARNR